MYLTKNKINHLGLIFLLILSISACTEDAFEQVVEIELPEHKPTLAATAQFSTGDTLLSLVVSHSRALLDTTSYQLLNDAEVVLRKNGNQVGQFNFDASSGKYVFPFTQQLASNDEARYTLDVNVDGFDAISAEQIMPNKVIISDVTYEEDGAITEDGEKADELIIDIDDPGDEENFYQVDVFEEVTIYGDVYRNHLYTSTLDPIVEYGYGIDNMLKDVTFNGKVYPLRIHLSPYRDYQFDDTKLIVRLTSMTRDKYLYHLSWAQYDDAQYNPFAEPVVVHGNFDGGFGVFTLETYTEFVVQL